MTTERDFSAKAPELPADLTPAVRSEVEKLWTDHRPWTSIRPTEKGTDNLSGATCAGCQGKFHLSCDKPVVAVQYNIQGFAQFYCHDHALEQDQWEEIFYVLGPTPTPALTKAQEAFIAKLLEKKKPKKKEEPEELDPTA